jgi:hypothetical protein
MLQNVKNVECEGLGITWKPVSVAADRGGNVLANSYSLYSYVLSYCICTLALMFIYCRCRSAVANVVESRPVGSVHSYSGDTGFKSRLGHDPTVKTK